MLIELPCITEESILARSAKENSAASVAVIGHRRECARPGTNILNLGPMFAIPAPCIAEESILACSAKEQHMDPVKYHPIAAARYRSRISDLPPSRSVPFPRVIQETRF